MFLGEHGIDGLKFFYANAEGERFYSDLKPAVVAEYRWVQARARPGALALDGGAHHGHYSVVLAASGYRTVAVDPTPYHVSVIRINAAVNDLEAMIDPVEAALWIERGRMGFTPEGCGGLLPLGQGLSVQTVTPWDLATGYGGAWDLVKLDVEGAEYALVPEILKRGLPRVLVVEIHRPPPAPATVPDLIRMVQDAGYETSHWKDGAIVPYRMEEWPDHATLFCERRTE